MQFSQRLDPQGVGDVEVAYYQALKPGKRVLLWYRDDNVWHENMIAWIIGGQRAVIFTPDSDMYIEDLGCNGAGGPTRLRGLTSNNKFPRGLNVYRFRDAISDDQIKQLISEAKILVKSELGGDPPDPLIITNSDGIDVTYEEFFGVPSGPARMRIHGKSPASGSDGPKNARKISAALADYVWVSAEPLGGLVLGQEVSLSVDTDVQIGDRTAIALRNGSWVKVEMIRVSDAADYAAKRIDLFKKADGSPPGGLKVLDALRSGAESGEKKDAVEDEGDVRTLWIDYDEHGERYKRWRDVCRESHSPTLGDKPLDGPVTALHAIKHMERHGGDPRMWLQMWMRTKHISTTDRVYHEMKVLCDALFYAGTFDQVNIPALMGFEVVCRRMQAIVDAYADPSKPSWENAKLFTGQGSPEDLVSPTFRSYATKKNRDELELLQARQKVRELRGGQAVQVDDAGAEALDSLPQKAKATPKSRGKAGKGQVDG